MDFCQDDRKTQKEIRRIKLPEIFQVRNMAQKHRNNKSALAWCSLKKIVVEKALFQKQRQCKDQIQSVLFRAINIYYSNLSSKPFNQVQTLDFTTKTSYQDVQTESNPKKFYTEFAKFLIRQNAHGNLRKYLVKNNMLKAIFKKGVKFYDPLLTLSSYNNNYLFIKTIIKQPKKTAILGPILPISIFILLTTRIKIYFYLLIKYLIRKKQNYQKNALSQLSVGISLK
eukprot:TRINITY_DN5918_c0_g2_i3.p2 TRINITY_DN5918_c0_g2~~TRINITY_DN5918_c0_g2_i3.p2  ORF type:complete len:247 (-),score=-6.23 TRINITY_DN5918_c0_g2_i3:679-1359(-)